jgi:DNA (cytosine-5)-methyltransferase 1
MTKKPLTVASLFSGAGGLDLGFKKAGFEIVWANDNDSDAVETYIKNFGDHCVLGDIEILDIKKLPKVDGIIGGFPCQGFSVANTQRTVDDSRNTLYKSFVKAVKHGQPKFFLAENVKGILSLGGGAVFSYIIKDFEKAGYICTYALVNAADYGVPQSRQRVLILGIRKDLAPKKILWPPKPTHEGRQISVGSALADVPDPDKPHKLKNHVYSQFKLKFNGYISNRRVDPNKPSPTITARGDHKGGAMIIHHPSNTRRMTCREVAIVQGFPINFEFTGSMTSVYKQIGNAVPPPLAFAAAKQILENLN